MTPAHAELEADLRRSLSGWVRFDDATLAAYSTDSSMYAIRPIGVVAPRDADDVAAAVVVAARHGVPVLSRGAGTSLAGQTVGTAVVLDYSVHMDAIGTIDADARTARVQPGVVQDDLNRAAAPHGLMFAPDTATGDRATLGGMIGNNSCGSRSARYGMTIDHVRSLHVILSDGTAASFAPADAEAVAWKARAASLEGRLYRDLPSLVERNRAAIETGYPQHWRRAGGYRLDRVASADGLDLARFVVGSEGTLVAVTGAVVDLVPVPRAVAACAGHFTSMAAAIDAANTALAAGAAVVEMVDDLILGLARRSPLHRDVMAVVEGEPAALLTAEFHADTLAPAAAAARTLARRWRDDGHAYAAPVATTASEVGRLRDLRKAGLGLLNAAGQADERPVAFVEDTAVDPARLGEYTRRFAGLLEQRGLRAGFYGHASAGCLHVRPFIDVGRAGSVEVMRAVAGEVQELVAEYGGSLSSEHGDGLARSELNRKVYGDRLYDAMREVKALFDPDGRMNPGKIVDAPLMTEHLRDAEPRHNIVLSTHFEFAGGMRAAADRCARIGACRASSGAAGTMCPSFRATREEEHSTRGRANALAVALASDDPAGALGDEDLHRALDLCLECKACKLECPLSIDMATLKSETLADYYEQHRVPLRARLFAAARTINRLGSRHAGLANRVSGNAQFRRALDRFGGIDRRRPLPHFDPLDLERWFETRPRARAGGLRGDVVFLADSFTSYWEPGVGRAAIELLEMAGWRVRLEAGGCCGRPAFSKGLLDDATRQAGALVDRVAPAAARGVPIVGCEPSCVLTLRDEYPALFPADARVGAVAARAMLVQPLLLAALDDGALRLDPAWPGVGSRVLFHGHCHEKAVVGDGDTAALLARLPGCEVEVLDAGCCGMAGSFGFEREHYDLSMRIGESRLLPAVRRAPEATIVAATGVSCRQQIAHGAGRRAFHPVELLRAAARS